MDAARAAALLDHLTARGLRIWVDGGWCIDALLHEQTRTHDDLDVVCLLEQAAAVEDAVGELGYALAGGGAPLSFELVDADGHQVDAHPITMTASGGLYRMADGKTWTYPAAGFSGVGRIDGREVACISAEVMMICHTGGYGLDADHVRDVERLSERFGIPLPAFRRA